MIKTVILIFVALSVVGVVLYSLYKGIYVQFRKTLTGDDGIWEKTGLCVKKTDRNSGKVFINGELWNAAWDDDVREGDKVSIVEIKDNIIFVKKTDER